MMGVGWGGGAVGVTQYRVEVERHCVREHERCGRKRLRSIEQIKAG